jgi:hypothetical protein
MNGNSRHAGTSRVISGKRDRNPLTSGP